MLVNTGDGNIITDGIAFVSGSRYLRMGSRIIMLADRAEHGRLQQDRNRHFRGFA
ncbi:MAG: hypothetical protein ACLTLQ_03510 [[Clostridium] scindens]